VQAYWLGKLKPELNEHDQIACYTLTHAMAYLLISDVPTSTSD